MQLPGKLQGIRHNILKIFKCPQCGSTFDRASQLGYHHRSFHLGERSQICQICEKGFFRKADLRTHLNIHLGTNFHICEVCGRKFSHISNLIRHCRMHTGNWSVSTSYVHWNVASIDCGLQLKKKKKNLILASIWLKCKALKLMNKHINMVFICALAGIKPYACVICGKHFTQVSSLARHRNIIHGVPKETMNQYCNPNLINNKSQVTNHALKEKVMRSLLLILFNILHHQYTFLVC